MENYIIRTEGVDWGGNLVVPESKEAFSAGLCQTGP
jgi:hypothetical protein